MLSVETPYRLALLPKDLVVKVNDHTLSHLQHRQNLRTILWYSWKKWTSKQRVEGFFYIKE